MEKMDLAAYEALDNNFRAHAEEHRQRVLSAVKMFMGMLHQAVIGGEIIGNKDLFWHLEQGGLIEWASALLLEVDECDLTSHSQEVIDFVDFMQAAGEGNAAKLNAFFAIDFL